MEVIPQAEPATQGDRPSAKVFIVGLPDTKCEAVAQLFALNGYVVQSCGKGDLAEEVLMDHALGKVPLKNSKAQVFSGFYSNAQSHRRPLYPAQILPILLEHYPDALIIRTNVPDESWILDRALGSNQKIRHHEQASYRLNPQRLYPFWLGLWQAQNAQMDALLDGHKNVAVADFEGKWQAGLLDTIGAQWGLSAHWVKEAAANTYSANQVLDVAAHLDATSSLQPKPKVAKARRELAEALAAHCLGTVLKSGGGLDRRSCSDAYGHWAGGPRVWARDGAEHPIRHVSGPYGSNFVSTSSDPKVHRVQGFLNEFANVSGMTTVQCDMNDARDFGLAPARTPQEPLVVYNRLPGARNMVLWPLVDYHTPFKKHYVTRNALDETPWDDKLDQVGWRGQLTGVPKDALMQVGAPKMRSGRILTELAGLGRMNAEVERYHLALQAQTRFAVTETYLDHPDFDLGLSLGRAHKACGKHGFLSRLLTPRVPLHWFHRFRYVLSLSGHDTGSNFLSAVNSNSLVFKEEDGWELFYTNHFKPWEHFVPLAPGATDILEKLAWARSHQGEVAEIRARARDASRRLADIQLREAFLSEICAGLRAIE